VSVSGEPRIELHVSECSCRGGAWVLLEATPQSPCGRGNGNAERLVLGMTEWRQRRQFQRFEVTMPLRIARIATWREPSAQSEDTRAEVMYVSLGSGPGSDGVQRLGLRFLDAPLPETLIPTDARPLA
jgi:hypothetical protein